jgi:hypothetical protein
MTDQEQAQAFRTAAGFAAETLFPGGSNALKGDLKTAGIFAALGFAARAALGLPGVLLVSAASFTKAVTGHQLVEVFGWGQGTSSAHATSPASKRT